MGTIHYFLSNLKLRKEEYNFVFILKFVLINCLEKFAKLSKVFRFFLLAELQTELTKIIIIKNKSFVLHRKTTDKEVN